MKNLTLFLFFFIYVNALMAQPVIAYDNASIAEQDERGKLIAAEDKGKREGKIAEKEAVIKRCWNEKMRLETIATITNLTVAEVQKVIEKIKAH